MAFCPMLAMVVLVAMSLHGISASNQQARLIETVVHQDFAITMRLSDSAAQLHEINGLLYRLTTMQASKAPGLDVAGEIARLVARTNTLADSLEGQASALSSPVDRTGLQMLVYEIRTYRDAIDAFGTILALDFTSAVGFIEPFDESASKVLDKLNAVAHHVTQDAGERAEKSARLARQIRLALVVVSACGALLLFGAAALLTRATVRSVKRIAAATEKVARGGADVDVDALARRDELGTIVRSLAVFQANASQIAFLAHHDPLTKLPNRTLFHDRVQQAMAQLDRGARFALLCLDLDRFKAVNDTLGHPVGDGLLRQVAERLRACVRDGDTVARLGGDEFAIILQNMSEPADVDRLAARIIEVISAGYEVDGHQVSVGTSIGVALAPTDGSTPDELFKNADTALYGAKANGRGTACFYEDAMNTVLQSRRTLEMSLQQAIAREEFQLHYQPLVESRSHRVYGFEALIRWPHPERGMIPPDVFIPVAESAGLIGVIGQWVLRRACLDAATWPDDVKVAVNLSALQFKNKELVADVRDALAASGLRASRLELEITESVLLHDGQATLSTLREMKALGVQIAMDDFGTGYSSLSYLRSFPFDKVKIDRSFIKDLPHDRNAAAIVRAIVGLSSTFGMAVTAEGVETDEQAMQLAIEACTQLQGYLFSKPVPAASVPGLIERLSATSPAVA